MGLFGKKIKMTYGTSDGSTTDGYNLDGSGYVSIANSTPSGTSGGYVSKMLFNKNGLIPVNASGSASTYYCDGLWYNNTQIDYILLSGCYGDKMGVGIFGYHFAVISSTAEATIGAALSCKPLAPTT